MTSREKSPFSLPPHYVAWMCVMPRDGSTRNLCANCRYLWIYKKYIHRRHWFANFDIAGLFRDQRYGVAGLTLLKPECWCRNAVDKGKSTDSGLTFFTEFQHLLMMFQHHISCFNTTYHVSFSTVSIALRAGCIHLHHWEGGACRVYPSPSPVMWTCSVV